MQESIFTSDQKFDLRFYLLLTAFVALASTLTAVAPFSAAWATEPGAAPHSVIPTGDGDDDDMPNAFVEYGEFNLNDEEADTQFFQHGRFFGVSIGLGLEAVSGNRGLLWAGGFPLFDFKLHYWFDFNTALDLNYITATHNFDTRVNQLGATTVNLGRIGADIKYYFDTKNLSAPISFANPYVLIGVGNFTKTEVSYQEGSTDESAVGLSLGAGLEFAMKPRKMYFELEGKVSFVNFEDTYSTDYKSHVPPLDDLTGHFFTLTGSVLFTW